MQKTKDYNWRYLSAILFLTAASFINLEGQIEISEILTNNLTVNMDPDYYAFSDWIELHNTAEQAVDLNGSQLVYEYLNTKKTYRINYSFLIPANSYLLVWADENNTLKNALHTNFKLQREGGTLSLIGASGDTLDQVTYEQQEVDVSLARDPEDQVWKYYPFPEPGSRNISKGFTETQRLNRPEFSVEGGLYDQAVTLQLSSSSTVAKIYYTLDGSKPTTGSQEYSGPITILGSTVVRAMSYDNTCLPSRTTTHSYLINEGITLPVMSISMEHDYFWDDEIGFYVEGTNGLTGWEAGYGPSPASNFNNDWRRPMHIEFFDEQHHPAFSIEGQVKVYGGWSRGAVIKSLAIYPEKSIGYKLFPEKPFENYESFILRNSGNDWPSTKIRDAALQSLAINELDLDLQANRPTVLFINGEFWGVLNIREKINEDYAWTNHGVNQDSLDFLEAYRTVKSGDKKHYIHMMDYLASHSLESPENYAYFKTLADVEECLNYFITGIYSGHGDWIYNGNNNLRLWRPRTDDGKWRWLLYDTDGCFSTTNGNGIARAMEYSTILSKLLENDEARNYFISTFTTLLNNAFAADRAVHMIDSLKALIEPDVARHIEKWKNTDDEGNPAAWKTPGSEEYIQIDDGYMGPSLSSFEAWESKFPGARYVASQRPAYLMDEIRSLFELGEAATVLFRTQEKNGGIIEVNGIEVRKDKAAGDTYFIGQNLQVEATPAYTYSFSHWNVESYSENTIDLINRKSEWNYLDDNTSMGNLWKYSYYDNSGWSTGNGELGYGDGGEATTLSYGPDSNNKYTTYYFRKKFVIDDPELYQKLTLNIVRDDGVVVYLNGSEVLRDNMPTGTIVHSTLASSAVGNADESTYFSFDIDASQLVKGENQVAVEIHQSSLTSSDISFDMEMKGTQLSPLDTRTIYSKDLDLEVSGNLLVTAVFDPTGTAKKLLINEFMAHNEALTWPHEEADRRDWIEIYNAGEKGINLAGMYISDNIGNPMKYRIPFSDLNQTSVLPGKYLILYADGEPELGPHHLGFSLNSEREQIILSEMIARELVIFDSIRYSGQIMDVSTGRYPDGSNNLILMSRATPERSNILEVPERISGLYINEVSSRNLSVIDEHKEVEDWIEVFNNTDEAICMAGLFFTDDLEEPGKWRVPAQYPDSSTVDPRDYLVLWADDDPEQGVRHLNFKLDGQGEQAGIFQLIDQEFVVVDTVSFGFLNQDRTFGRFPDASDHWKVLETYTPGATNGTVEIVMAEYQEPDIKVYPNPSDGQFTLEFISENIYSGETEPYIAIFGIDSKLLNLPFRNISWDGKTYRLSADLSGFPEGAYVIRLVSAGEVYTSRVLIRK